MTPAAAQNIINAIPRFQRPTASEISSIQHLKVDYASAAEMPGYKQERLEFCLSWILSEYPATPFVDLVMSQLDGYPIDEFTHQADFDRIKAILGKSKFSDWDFIVPSISGFQRIEQVAPVVRVDLFSAHHNGVRALRIYEAG